MLNFEPTFGNRFMNCNHDQSDLIPGVQWLRHYPKAWLQPDITAGLTTARVITK